LWYCKGTNRKRIKFEFSGVGNDQLDMSLEKEKVEVNEKELKKGEWKEDRGGEGEGKEEQQKREKEKKDVAREQASQLSEEEGEDDKGKEKEMDSKEMYEAQFEKLLEHQMDSSVGSREKLCYIFPLCWIANKCYNYEEIWRSTERYCQYRGRKFPKGHLEEAL
jgi:hypothetical protein